MREIDLTGATVYAWISASIHRVYAQAVERHRTRYSARAGQRARVGAGHHVVAFLRDMCGLDGLTSSAVSVTSSLASG